MMLAPYLDCARQLELDVPAVFEEAAGAAASDLADHVRGFGRRGDIRPRSFGYARKKEPEGPAYYTRD